MFRYVNTDHISVYPLKTTTFVKMAPIDHLTKLTNWHTPSFPIYFPTVSWWKSTWNMLHIPRIMTMIDHSAFKIILTFNEKIMCRKLCNIKTMPWTCISVVASAVFKLTKNPGWYYSENCVQNRDIQLKKLSIYIFINN